MSRYPRRNQTEAPSGASCSYDTAVGFLDGTATTASATMTVEPGLGRPYMDAKAVHITVLQAANPVNNGRAKVNFVRAGSCDLESYNVADGVATGGRIAPDEFQSGDGECCLGKPVCWGWFGKDALDLALQIRFTNLSTFAADIYASVTGRSANALPAGVTIGQRCS